MIAHFDAPAPLLPELVSLNARWLGSKPALVAEGEHGSETLSWAELEAAANRVANALRAGGVTAGDAVAVAMDNRAATVTVLLGIIKAGGIATPLNLTATDAALAAMIDDCQPRVVLACADEARRLDPLAGTWTGVATARVPGWQDLTSWTAGQSAAAPSVVPDGDDSVNIIYSSGTTGRPKGIVHTHRRRLGWAQDLALALRYHRAARTLCSLPLYSNISWVMLLCTVVCGGTLYLMRRFDAGRWLELAERERISHTAMVPVQFQRLVDHPAFATTSRDHMQAMMSCGSPLPPQLKETLLRSFPCGVIELYGLTEGVITTLDPEEAPGRVESVGRPLPGTDLKIIDDAGREVPTGTPGEIVSRGRILMAGYLHRPDASAEATWLDSQGRRWLRTGDLGRLDDDGFLYIVGRKKDMILSGGQNIYPADIEAVLITHPDVADAAVIGVPSERWGETPLAVVEAAAGRQVDTPALTQWLNGRLGRYQRVSAIVVTDELPRNPNGKVLKRVLRDQHAAGGLATPGRGAAAS